MTVLAKWHRGKGRYPLRWRRIALADMSSWAWAGLHVFDGFLFVQPGNLMLHFVTYSEQLQAYFARPLMPNECEDLPFSVCFENGWSYMGGS